MNLREHFQALKSEKMTVEKASKYFMVAPFIFICIAIGSYDAGRMKDASPFSSDPFRFAPLVAISGCAFSVISELGLRGRKVWGKVFAILSYLLIFAIFALFFASFELSFWHKPAKNPFSYISIVFGLAMMAYIAIHFFFDIRAFYKMDLGDKPMATMRADEQAATQKESQDSSQYHHSLFKLSDQLIQLIMIGPFVILGLIAFSFATNETIIYFLPVMFGYVILILSAWVIGNYIVSPFQRPRKLISSFEGGGRGKGILNASFPFYRMLLYEDGLEIRFMFNRYFIPFDRMESFSIKKSLQGSGIEINSNLPGVPTQILFFSLSSRKTFDLVNQHRNQYLAAHGKSATIDS